MTRSMYSTPSILRVTANGQISIPAAVRHRWKTNTVTAVDTPWGLVVRPFDRVARLATSDPALLDLVVDEGGLVEPLPGRDGSIHNP